MLIVIHFAQVLAFQFADAMLGGNRAAKLHGAVDKTAINFPGLRGLNVVARQNVDVHVIVADVAKDMRDEGTKAIQSTSVMLVGAFGLFFEDEEIRRRVVEAVFENVPLSQEEDRARLFDTCKVKEVRSFAIPDGVGMLLIGEDECKAVADLLMAE